MTDNDRKKDFNEAYDSASTYWAEFLQEAETDLSVALGDQWDASQKSYLKKQRRNALVFNKVRRVIKMIEGYQRKNRLSMKIAPVEGQDEVTSSQLSQVVQWQMQTMNGYHQMSDAFSGGCLKTGINLMNLHVDFSNDPLNGEIKIKRVPYNRFLLDPMFSERDLSDCGFICRREYLGKDAMLNILPPDARKEAAKISPAGFQDMKYTGMPILAGAQAKDMYRYDEFWRRTYKNIKVLVNLQDGSMVEWKKTDERLKFILQTYPDIFRVFDRTIKGVEQIILVEDNVVHHGPEPSGLDDFPFVPIIGFWNPEYDNSSMKLQGIVRCMRDPQTEVNKRRSKMLDIIDSQIATGWQAVENSVVNPEALFQSGQGQVVWMKNDLEAAKKLIPPDIPPGMMGLSEILDKDIMEIPGANSELFGMAEMNSNIETAGILAKARVGQGLTILQDIFDNYRLSKKLLGIKLVKMIQKNYQPAKIIRIIGEQPTQEFYNTGFSKYDCIPKEGVLSDSQKEMSFIQLMGMKKLGAPIPWAALIDAAPLERKKELKDAIKQQEDAMKQQQQTNQKLQDLNIAKMQADIAENQANARRDNTQAQENQTKAMLDRLKAVSEIKDMDQNRVMQILEFIAQINRPQGQQRQQGQIR